MRIITTLFYILFFVQNVSAQTEVEKRMEFKRLELLNEYYGIGKFDPLTGIATVNNRSEGSGYIDTSGTLILPLGSYSIYDFSDGVGVYYDNNNSIYKVIDKTGKVLNTFSGISSLARFENGLGVIQDASTELYGLMDLAGKRVLACNYRHLYKIYDGLYAAEEAILSSRSWSGVINTKGDVIIPFEYTFSYFDFEAKTFMAYKPSAAYNAIFDFNQNVKKNLGKKFAVSTFCVDYMFYNERDGVVVIREKNTPDIKFALVTKNFDTIVPYGKYFHIGEVNEGMVKVSNARNTAPANPSAIIKQEYTQSGFIDTKGKLVIPMQYDFAGYFQEGVCVVSKNGKYGYIDKKGNVAIPFIYDYCLPFTRGYAKVQINDEFFIIDRSGKRVLPARSFRYD